MTKEQIHFICVWCHKEVEEAGLYCCAPDGEGHLFQRTIFKPNGGQYATQQNDTSHN